MTIYEKQEEIISQLDTLIAEETLNANFSISDNDVNYSDLPLIIVDLATSNPKNLSSGQTGLTDHVFKLFVIAPISDHSDSIGDAREFVIDQFQIILDNLDIDCGKVYYELGIYKEKQCARVRVEFMTIN